MGKITGFMEATRELPKKRRVEERIRDYKELYLPVPEEKKREQAGRCMNCGIPFCHTGCPLGNLIPDWNDLVYTGNWKAALDELHATNNFPEFTGRLCPAPCEEACVLGINEPAVTIEEIEKSIIERGFAEGWVKPVPPASRTGKKVAVIGSGPSGLACAQQLNRAGHSVTVLERADRIGGLLRYGIPHFKMEKWVIDRRLDIMAAEGVEFKTSVEVGKDVSKADLEKDYDAVVFCGGATISRDLPIEGRDLEGVEFAMEFLPQSNSRVEGDDVMAKGVWQKEILATGKDVIVIGGGDTGSDCIGTSIRQGATSVENFELMPMPPVGRPENQPWPFWPMKFRTSSSHEEGCERHYSVLTNRFLGEDGKLTGLETINIEMGTPEGGGRPQLKEIEGTERIWPCQMAVLALGFLGPETDSIVSQYGCDLDARGNVKVDKNWMSSTPGFFAAGDCQRGQSLIVWAISDGRECAVSVDEYLMKKPSELPRKMGPDLPRV
ncbi:MAG: glutamate synthase subunit beta [Kiritimatiellae bacterium]|jgi:glutamate synthase (NADPH/NADH) small chain|nr:glutamate synthase subunit beta [Kiritimatiellia bacterium]